MEIVPFTADCIVVPPVVSVESSLGVADALFEISVYEPPPSFAATTYVFVSPVLKLFTVNVVEVYPYYADNIKLNAIITQSNIEEEWFEQD